MLLSRSIPLSRRQYQGPQDMQPLRALVILRGGLTDYVFNANRPQRQLLLSPPAFFPVPITSQ